MNKRILAIAIVALLVLTAMPLVAQNGQTLNIGGLVPLILDLTITPDGIAQDLPLVGNNDDEVVVVADITISTNNSTGFELLAISQNGLLLINANADEIGYDIAFVPEGNTPTFGVIDANDVIFSETDPTLDTPITGTIQVQFDQSENHPAGYYSDQIALVLRTQ